MSQWETLCVQITMDAENEIIEEKENFFIPLGQKYPSFYFYFMQVIEQPWTSQSQLLDHRWQPLPTLPWLLTEDYVSAWGR